MAAALFYAAAKEVSNIVLTSCFQVDELAAQIKLEFDFEREARIMDTIRGHLRGQGALKNIEVPRSIPGLTTKRLLVMSFLDGVQARACN